MLTLICVITNATAKWTFEITDRRLYLPVVTLSTQDNAKLLQQLKSGFQRTINWNKFPSKTETCDDRYPYLDCFIDPSFQGVNKLFVLSFENDADRREHTAYYLQKVEIKD